VIAKEVVNSNKAVNRLTTQKAHMMDMEMALKHQLGVACTVKASLALLFAGCLALKQAKHVNDCCIHFEQACLALLKHLRACNASNSSACSNGEGRWHN
jgi:hypothetical protein